MKIRFAKDGRDARLWEEFVGNHPESRNYHRWAWKIVIERSFNWSTFYLMAEENAKVSGILPLVWQKSRLFGSFVTSLPFLNSGGILAEERETEEVLLEEAIALTRRLGAKHLELRHRRNHQLDLCTQTNKVALVLPAESDKERMWRSLPTKVRTGIRKAEKFGLTAEFGRKEFVDDFYEVFAENMRDLGTPVYGKKFFLEIVSALPSESFVCIVRHNATPVAVSFLAGYRDTLETLWGSSLDRYRSMKPNMFMYWKMLCFAGKQGYRVFDFGRSTVGSGPHRFKRQWGAQEIPLYWNYWLRNECDLPELTPQNPRYRLAIRLWQRVPLVLTKLIGPRIVRCLP